MATENTKHPWNEYHGLTEGDMIEELVEHDTVRFEVPEAEVRAALVTYAPEEVRRSWWYAIGRHTHAL